MASVGGFYVYQQLNPAPSCADPLGGAKILRTQLAPPTTIGGVTEFALPSPLREPNAPTVAPDGSVWFGEQSVAGLAHFYPGNRTLVEYAWPFNYPAPPSTAGICGNKSDIWGVTLWNGKVWASDTSGNQLVALDPSTGQFSTVKIPTNSSYPYTLTPGPNNTLWFPELFGAKIGELSSNGTLREYPLPGGVDAAPAQIVFANSTTGFYSDVGDAGADNGGIYSFNAEPLLPRAGRRPEAHRPVEPHPRLGRALGRAPRLLQRGELQLHDQELVLLPHVLRDLDRSPVTTLPYFVDANGSEVWVNEHYGNRMALIDPANGSLVEYSESSTPVNGNTIGNALTFALGGGRAWFTEWTGERPGLRRRLLRPWLLHQHRREQHRGRRQRVERLRQPRRPRHDSPGSDSTSPSQTLRP